MIRAVCTTNLDGYKTVQWPEFFLTIPRIGDRVRDIKGTKELKVVGVTHCAKKITTNNVMEYYIEVELHRGF